MSKLYATERGFVVPSMGEELTQRRRARKVLELPPTASPGRLFILAGSHPANERPLRLRVGDTELRPVPPAGPGYLWYDIEVPSDALPGGRTTIELWCDADAMDGWSLGIEYGPPPTGSSLSWDAGATWRSDRLGHMQLGSGEYLVRMRLAESMDPRPPSLVMGRPDAVAAERLRALLPTQVVAPGDTLDRVRALATWTSTAWRYQSTATTGQHAPWDPLTILAWGSSEVGHSGREPVVMCVHYGVVFVAACAAVGIPARAAVLAESINGPGGHFAAEVWLPAESRWIFVDANEDALFYEDGRPMSVEQIQAAPDLRRHVRWGPGHEYQIQQPAMRRWIDEVLLSGVCFRHRAVWYGADFGSDPLATPPAHGETAYSELDLIWAEADLDDGFGMFRWFGDQRWFLAAPGDAP